MKKNANKQLSVLLKGVAMGAADVVPGVSGGTIAFITGIYDRLIAAIRSFNGQAIQHLLKKQFYELWQHIDGNFLLSLFGGIFISIISLSRLVIFLLENHPILLWSFFFGLILASTIQVAKTIKPWSPKLGFFFMAGVSVAFYITTISPSETTNAYWFIFLSGAIAICAMILPGISGSFILLLLGKYEFILNAIKSLQISTILIFGLGCISGLLSFSHFLNWLLQRYKALTVALLAGFMLGSLNKVWPWKKAITTYINSKGVEKPIIEQNLLPWHYEQATNMPANLGFAILLALFGFGLVLLLDKLANKQPRNA